MSCSGGKSSSACGTISQASHPLGSTDSDDQHPVEDGCGALPDTSSAINVAVERAQALSRMLVNGKAGASVDDFLRDRSADGEGTPVTVG
jgi:hypothetical protein